MADTAKVAISEGFLTAFAALPKKTQSKVADFMNRFRNNPASPGINYEKVESCRDAKICSVRIDDKYRGIVAREAETGIYLLLWVALHDDAYAWAKSKKCAVNAKTGVVQVYSTETTETETAEKETPETALFSDFSDNDLLELGLPEDMLSFARRLKDAPEFHAASSSFPTDAFENLSWLVEGFPLEEVRALVLETSQTGGSLVDAIESPESMRSFVVIEGETELRRILAEPLEKWRVFLHPAQRKIAAKTYSGAARVLGGAGTGKTVVAMHRAAHLAAKAKDNDRILFTTFTTNLASDIQENLRKICTTDQLRRIEVVNLDAWVMRFLREQGYPAEIVYDDRLTQLWETAVALGNPTGEFPVSFYQEEYNRVALAQEALTLEKYIKAARTGRGTRLDRAKRMKVWEVFAAYQDLLKEQQVRDINTAMYECRLLLPSGEPYYQHVIVDEGQDLSANAFRLLRAIAGEEHENDIFIVGDAHQRIYKNRAVLSKCGINVRGRSSILRINYRTTDEIRKAAFALLNGLPFDDLDQGTDTADQCQSLTHGSPPKVRSFAGGQEEFDAVLKEIRDLVDNGVPENNICVVARTHKLLDEYKRHFTGSGLHYYEIRNSKVDDPSQRGIRVATMHRVKGLEFQYVFIVAANKNILPLSSAIDHTDKVSEQETEMAEKCLLYVALTRAQKCAYISSYGKPSEFLAGSISAS